MALTHACPILSVQDLRRRLSSTTAYVLDFGPGVVRRAQAAVLDRHIAALQPGNLKVAFVTHLHSDHTAGYSDLIFTRWTAGRRTPLEVYGLTTGRLHSTPDVLQKEIGAGPAAFGTA